MNRTYQLTDKELAERYKMALEAILELKSYYGMEVAQDIAKRAIK